MPFNFYEVKIGAVPILIHRSEAAIGAVLITILEKKIKNRAVPITLYVKKLKAGIVIILYRRNHLGGTGNDSSSVRAMKNEACPRYPLSALRSLGVIFVGRSGIDGGGFGVIAGGIRETNFAGLSAILGTDHARGF
jgi:hypothetical protein